jgi:redox-sensitive bicupin YhaK (pirin superfamily)
VIRGPVELNGHVLNGGDGAAIENESRLDLIAAAETEAEAILFDLPNAR